METYLLQPTTFMYSWLSYCDGNHIERIPIVVKNIDHLFCMASEIIESDKLHLLLLSDGTWIDDNEYLESLETATELIVCTEEQIQKLLIYSDVKRYLHFKNISTFGYFCVTKTGGCFFQNNFDKYLLSSFVEAVLSSTFYQVLFKVFL